ncbi:TetR family transcriptional regulator [Stackebrandtia albiflava]|uniref:TetR family transcriptional regulator n=1 Tax=Stackebrandtia albiflava TaxID=406432 RepID=A0A562V9J8_9ACTN|nr:TetR/AcrR family transcriptional regulator [Stackebrandtia albiflava]TWJ14487.1 TetR family transcriptional regulator [Stackebrandtia albiflava]
MVTGKSGGRRAQKARETRARILAAARDLFVSEGYGTTSLQEVADRAGVAVQTIYFGFGNKRTVLKELVDVTVAGDDAPVATMERPWFREMIAAPTAAEHLRRQVEGSGAILERLAPIDRVVKTAAAMDPDVAAMWPEDDDPRAVVLTASATALLRKPDAREELTTAEATDILFGLLSPELYLVMVERRGWDVERWKAWTCRTLRAQLCRE